jgi:hypothetical protein
MLTFGATGLVIASVQGQDDQGRPVVTASVDNGKLSTETNTYTALGDAGTETFITAGQASVGHVYNSTTSATPDALQALTVTTPTQSTSQGYTYDPTTKRLKTIVVNGVTFTIAYMDNSNQIESITAGSVITTFDPGASNPSLLGGITVTAPGQTVYGATYGYNAIDQITSANVIRTNPDDTVSTDNNVYTFGSGTNPAADTGSDADSLTQVTDNGTVKEIYSYDGVGNFTNNSMLGTANALNQYENLQYNARGSVLDDGTYAYTYDANNRMISVTPHDTTQKRLTYGYDSQGRRLWKDIYSWNSTSGTWQKTDSRAYAYDGTNVIGELNQAGTMVTGYTWGANGQLLAVTDYTQSSPKTYAAVIDASGNTAMLVDPTNGAVGAGYKYDAYGNLLSATGPAQAICSILGKGLWYDIEARSIGHALFRDTRNNIWYERDPAGEIVGGTNLYMYLGGDPINEIDTSGLLVSQVESWVSDLGRKYFDPVIVRAVNRLAGASAAHSVKSVIASSRDFTDGYIYDTDLLRHTGNLVDSLLDGSAVASVRSAYQMSGSVPLTVGQVTGMNNLPAGIYNAQVISSKPTPVGGRWARFMAIGNGTAATLNVAAAAGSAATTSISFVDNVSIGMGRQPLSAIINNAGAKIFVRQVTPITGGSAGSISAPDRVPIPGDADFIGPMNGNSWKLSPNGMGAHLVERANVSGRPSLSVLDEAGTPTYYPRGTPEAAGAAHLRLHEATAGGNISLRTGGISAELTDQELLEAYAHAYSDPLLEGIKGDLRVPGGATIATNVSPAEAYQALLRWLSVKK